jgi:hypothetical protein
MRDVNASQSVAALWLWLRCDSVLLPRVNARSADHDQAIAGPPLNDFVVS